MLALLAVASSSSLLKAPVVLTIILAVLALLSLLLTLWQWTVAFRFPLHQPAANISSAPPVTLLKPLKGIDCETAACLRSWLVQQYAGEAEVLFGVASADDPVRELVRQLLANHPKASARLVICPQALRANAQVSTLIQLKPQAQQPLTTPPHAEFMVA